MEISVSPVHDGVHIKCQEGTLSREDAKALKNKIEDALCEWVAVQTLNGREYKDVETGHVQPIQLSALVGKTVGLTGERDIPTIPMELSRNDLLIGRGKRGAWGIVVRQLKKGETAAS